MVPNSKTLGEIQESSGGLGAYLYVGGHASSSGGGGGGDTGAGGAVGRTPTEPSVDDDEAFSPYDGSPGSGFMHTQSAGDKRLRVFLRSLAGYSVASYVLGFGDRHNDNVMVHRETGSYTRACVMASVLLFFAVYSV